MAVFKPYVKPAYDRGDQLRAACELTGGDGTIVPAGTPGECVEPWPIFGGGKRNGAPTGWRYICQFGTVTQCWADETELTPLLLGWT